MPRRSGRAISDVRLRGGTFSPPEEAGAMTLLCGRAPVRSNSYSCFQANVPTTLLPGVAAKKISPFDSTVTFALLPSEATSRV